LLRKLKIRHISLLPILLISFILFKLVNNTEILVGAFKYVVSILSYIIWGFGIAYMLNPLMVYLEARLKLQRISSMLAVYTLFLGCIVFFITIITPIIINNVGDLLDNLPRYLMISRAWIDDKIMRSDLVSEYNLKPFVDQNINNLNQQVTQLLKVFLDKLISNAISLTSTLLKFVFGIAISIYMLKDKELFLRSIKRALYAFFNKSSADWLTDFGSKVNVMFSRFLLGKALDSFIIGVICYLGLLWIQIPYALLISVIVTVTNMIPYFGPFIGAVPSLLIVLFHSPIKAVWFSIFFFVLQQFDGWILVPRILGNKVGLSPFWIIVAILVGGGTFGVIGMVIGVPVVAVVKVLFSEIVEKRLKAKEIDVP
jgi:predicted PurR-regulated permease PerM